MFVWEVLVRLQRLVLLSYAIEHDVKIEDLVPEAIQGNFHLEEYAAFKSAYPEVYERFFQNLEDTILSFTKDMSLEDMELLFKKIRDPKIMQEKIDALAALGK